jgi:hypothetical protein
VQETLNSITNRFKPVINDGNEALIDLTAPDYPEGQSTQDAMHHPYQLCGVATRRDVIYLLHPDTTSNTPGAKQWWRVQYDTESGTANIIRDKIDQQQVLERATSEAASVLLVYANETALSETPLPLSKPLEDFVKKDKLCFLEELQKNHGMNAGDWVDYGDEPKGNWDEPKGNWDEPKGNWDEPKGNWEPEGNWSKSTDPPGYNHDWANISAQQYFDANRKESSGQSSATLTPNTEADGDPGVREMVEVNGGMDALSGLRSDPMDVDIQTQSTQMVDVKEVPAEEPKAQHIEFAQKKGG